RKREVGGIGRTLGVFPFRPALVVVVAVGGERQQLSIAQFGNLSFDDIEAALQSAVVIPIFDRASGSLLGGENAETIFGAALAEAIELGTDPPGKCHEQ